MVGLIIASATFLCLALLIRVMADKHILWAIIPANCYALVTTKSNDTGDLTKGGGGVVDIIHNVPGKKLDKRNHNLMEWCFKNGRESRSILFIILGVEWIGPFRTLRTNKIRRFRYSKRSGDRQAVSGSLFKDYEVQDDDLTTKYVPFSGEQAVPIVDAESIEFFELNFLLNAIEESTYPLKAIRVADANAILAGMIKEKINALTGTRKPDEFLKASPESTRLVVNAAMTATAEAEVEIGKRIIKINLVTTDMDEADRNLFELAARTEKTNAAKIAEAERVKKERILEAEGQAQAKRLNNETDEERLTRILLPAATTGLTSEVFRSDREAAALERLTNLSTLVIGGGAIVSTGKG